MQHPGGEASPTFDSAKRVEMKRISILIAILTALVCSSAPAQNYVSIGAGDKELSSSPPDSKAGSPVLEDRNHRYRLRAGDTFDVDFTLSPEFNQTLSVQPDGFGSLKGVGTIPMEGKTLPELTEAIRQAYAHILHEPLIVIVLKDFDKPYFTATGQVSKPGKYDLRSDLTITEALAVAGGFNDKAKTSQVVLFRRSSGGSFEGRVYNLKKLLASRNLSEDPRVLPGDLLFVPQSTYSQLKPFMPTMSTGVYYNPAHY
jgi:polysaccharide export outer membrane protein